MLLSIDSSFLVTLFALSLILVILQIFFTIKGLDSEKKGCLRLGDAAQELNNKTLHEAAEKMFISNKLKYWTLILIIIQVLFITGIMSIISVGTH